LGRCDLPVGGGIVVGTEVVAVLVDLLGVELLLLVAVYLQVQLRRCFKFYRSLSDWALLSSRLLLLLLLLPWCLLNSVSLGGGLALHLRLGVDLALASFAIDDDRLLQLLFATGLIFQIRNLCSRYELPSHIHVRLRTELIFTNHFSLHRRLLFRFLRPEKRLWRLILVL
jgi:hypothetical protein